MGARASRDADATTPFRTTFLRRGQSSAVHRHDETAAWIHVVAGEVVEERWTRDAEGGFVHERRTLRCGQSMAAPADALHRVTAVDDAAFVTTCACDCARARAVPARELDAVTRLARCGEDREWATATAIGVASPRDAG
ncbi:Hypothetical protein I5071_42520 [Sandaracinus amylolyticus]|nr:Hypothetical protein I5071_42520 [Sandaracinus amylolyticus]